ncbi:MAG: tetratricopeptide repeat protein [Candidatus Poribacteria bacterium]|nr:tetratricopeptide repeat protein [Candidatus Poribacteria bacterium]
MSQLVEAWHGIMCEIERRAAMSEFASPFDALYKRALLHAQNREHAEAIDAFTEALRHAPEYADAYVRRGMCYAALNDLERAVQDYSRAIELEPEHAGAYYWRAGAWLRLKEWKKAAADRALAVQYGSEDALAIDRIMEDYKRAWEVLG